MNRKNDIDFMRNCYTMGYNMVDGEVEFNKGMNGTIEIKLNDQERFFVDPKVALEIYTFVLSAGMATRRIEDVRDFILLNKSEEA